MVELTPELLGNSFIVVLVSYAIAFAFQLYMLYLNWKQSRVHHQMDELIAEVKEIKGLLKKKKK
ncbi:hypothetical protein JXC34_00950 [Candidatus Woesearchaeota archaeon]|nr:hypothetical protein [Candidatus Woesearchaeota archaeon]